jgi:hypothetical protein
MSGYYTGESACLFDEIDVLPVEMLLEKLYKGDIS